MSFYFYFYEEQNNFIKKGIELERIQESNKVHEDPKN